VVVSQEQVVSQAFKVLPDNKELLDFKGQLVNKEQPDFKVLLENKVLQEKLVSQGHKVRPVFLAKEKQDYKVKLVLREWQTSPAVLCHSQQDPIVHSTGMKMNRLCTCMRASQQWLGLTYPQGV